MYEQEILQFAQQLKELTDRTIANQSYEINILDELHVNENAHSRILCKLLQYKNQDGKYLILESLINYIVQDCGKSHFENIRIDKPRITQEEERIDLWVRDSTYAIIMENKVKNAVDQNTQLARYIQKTRAQHYKDENIYIIYLPSDSHDPSENSWYDQDNGKSLKDDFKDRYIQLSFKKHIIRWLEKDVLPKCNKKDYLLTSAIQQYLDHLKGLFQQRSSQQKNIKEVEQTIKKELGLENKTLTEQISLVDAYIQSLNGVNEALKLINDELHKLCFEPYITLCKEYWKDDEYIVNDCSQSGYIQIYDKKWKNDRDGYKLAHLHMEFVFIHKDILCNPHGVLPLEIHYEGQDEVIRSVLYEKLGGSEKTNNDMRVLYHHDYLISSFLNNHSNEKVLSFIQLSDEAKREVLFGIFNDVKPLWEQVVEVVNSMLVVKLFKEYNYLIKEKNFLFRSVWMWQTNYLVLENEDSVIDINCQSEGEVHLSFFNRNGDIAVRFAHKKELVLDIGKMLIYNENEKRYKTIVSNITGNKYGEIIDFISALIKYIQQ